MPHFTVQIREQDLDAETEPRLIKELTEAVASVYGDWARSAAVVDLYGIPGGRHGACGVPSTMNAPIVTFTTREGALDPQRMPDTPARLISAFTDAIAAVFGEPVREHVNVLIVGVPAGRSGVGGNVV
jgi:phenylpyruvate tautomerase PptA (4-oxalocrotonate tautomerase family)